MQDAQDSKTLPLAGRVALVTGGSSGIGRASAISLARAGAKVVLGARRAEQGQAVADEIAAAGGQARFLVTDVTRAKDSKALVDLAVEAFGGLDVAFNNAGTEGAGLLPLLEDSEDNLRRVMEVNFFGLWHSLRAELPALTARGGGSIINTSSVAGLKGFGFFSSYASSKFAVEGLSRSVAAEVAASNIRVNTIAPGPVATEMLERATGGDFSVFTDSVPLQRAAAPEEVAELVTFLASDRSSFVTGHSLRVDGGMLA